MILLTEDVSSENIGFKDFAYEVTEGSKSFQMYLPLNYNTMCDISKFQKNDDGQHPFFTERMKKWDGGCRALDNGIEINRLTANSCLTEEEAACYSSYILNKKRDALDASIADIYQPQNSIAATYDSNYQTTMLTGVIWAALGTTILYYAFTKL